MSSITPSAQYRLTIRVEIDDTAGTLAELTGAIGAAGGMVVAVDPVEMDSDHSVRDIVVDASGREHWEQILAAIRDCDSDAAELAVAAHIERTRAALHKIAAANS